MTVAMFVTLFSAASGGLRLVHCFHRLFARMPATAVSTGVNFHNQFFAVQGRLIALCRVSNRGSPLLETPVPTAFCHVKTISICISILSSGFYTCHEAPQRSRNGNRKRVPWNGLPKFVGLRSLRMLSSRTSKLDGIKRLTRTDFGVL